MRYIRQVKAWDINRPETLKHITPNRAPWGNDAEQFEKVRTEYIRQLEHRLQSFRLREQIRRCEFPALFGRLAVPLHRLGIVLLHAVAVRVAEAKVELRDGVALLSKRPT